MSDFVQEVLAVSSEETYLFFSITCISAPTLGVVAGGSFFSAIGGYNNPRAFTWCMIIGSWALVFAAPLPFSEEKWLTYCCTWMLLFVGASILTPLTGIMLNAVEESRRPAANSLATLIYNLLGYFPAPFLYGAIAEKGNGTEDEIFWSRAAMGTLMTWTIIVSVFIIAGFLDKKF